MSLKELLYSTKLYYPAAMLKSSYKDALKIAWARICVLFPVEKNKIVCSSFHGTAYNAEPLKISDKLLKQGVDYDIVWELPQGARCSNEVRSVKTNSFKYIYELATAGVWIDNCRKPYWIKKKKGQLYIQTWHGSVCIKAIEKDAQDTLHPFYVKSAIVDSKNADYIVAEAEWRAKNIYQSFWYNGELIKGEFKQERVHDKKEIDALVRNELKIENNKRIALYAPTFRKDGGTNHYLKEFELLSQKLNKSWGGEWVVIVRLHPNVANASNEITFNETVFNGTLYPVIDDLIEICDLLITDYSGCMFNGFRSNKPVFLYAEDIEDYTNSERKLYFDLKALPSPLSSNIDELISQISVFDSHIYNIRCNEFVKSLGYYDDDAAELCADIIRNYVISNKD